jgi:putative flippase GtrA
MTEFVLTPELLAAIVSAVLSLAFSYIPKLNTTFAAWSTETKRLVMAGMLLAVSGAVLGLSCASILISGISCDQNGLTQLVSIFISALVANQGVFALTPQVQSVKDAKSD